MGVKNFGNAPLGVRTDRQTTHPRAITELRVLVGGSSLRAAACPGILERRRDMIIPAAPVIPSDENRRGCPILALRHRVDPRHRPGHAQLDAGRWMFA